MDTTGNSNIQRNIFLFLTALGGLIKVDFNLALSMFVFIKVSM